MMEQLHLVIGNKNYSSWSLRPWIAMKEKGVDFTETVIALDMPDTAQKIAAASPSGRVPVLQHGGRSVWESLAILEYVAELYPERGFWPAERGARALARSVCNEMHAGFGALRSACPMNLRRPVKPVALSDKVLADVARIEALWAQCLGLQGAGAAFLFGEFTNADAMFAPVVARFETFAIPVSQSSRAYMNRVMGTASFQAWKQAALAESWVVPSDEVD
jgi:glutathione S-transferase